MEETTNTIVNTEQTEVKGNVADKKSLAFGKVNFILLAVSMLIVIIGFILMSGSASDETSFDADIFSTMRIKVAPVVCFVGFISMIFAIVYKSKDDKEA